VPTFATDPNVNPGIDSACAPTDASDHNRVTGVDLSASFGLKVASDTANTAEDGVGEATGAGIDATLSNWFSFDSFYRLWAGGSGVSPWPDANWNAGCDTTSPSCQLMDWTLKAAASVIRNTTGNGSTANGAVVAGACPAEANGTAFLTSQTYTYDSAYFSGLNGVRQSNGAVCASGDADCVQRYLKSAVEILGDDVGDEDGLCEDSEACLYTPNFGAYQGHGTLTECTFTGGTITGVTMFYYPTNGY
jgi:hypothetical protein